MMVDRSENAFLNILIVTGFLLLFAVFVTAVLKKPSIFTSDGQRGKKSETIEKTAGITFNDFLDPMIADGFDFPVGNVDGQGSYVTKTDGNIIKEHENEKPA